MRKIRLPNNGRVIVLGVVLALAVLAGCQTTETADQMHSRWIETWSLRLAQYLESEGEIQTQEEELVSDVVLARQDLASAPGSTISSAIEQKADQLIQVWYHQGTLSGRIAVLSKFAELQATDPTPNMVSAWAAQQRQTVLSIHTNTQVRLDGFVKLVNQPSGYDGDVLFDAYQVISEHGAAVGAVEELALIIEEHEYYTSDLRDAQRADEELASEREAGLAAVLLGLTAAAAAASY